MGFYADEKMEVRFGLKNGAANIARWRLEKKYPDQEISVPIKPITFLISPEVPKKWRPYLKAGIEEWLPAFESAGFKDALVVKEVDSLDQWQAHSIHSNVVYWNQRKYFRGSEYEDYGGTLGHIIDLRTGEILRGDIFMGASERTVCEKYFVRAAPLDKRAQRFPFPDALTGRLFQVIAAHEAGHVFGIMDANFGEYHYPWNKMNDSLWLRIMGHTPSIMNYTRTNNIPQPEDSVPQPSCSKRLGPRIGTTSNGRIRNFQRTCPQKIKGMLWNVWSDGRIPFLGIGSTSTKWKWSDPMHRMKWWRPMIP